ncbi:MAG: restriction endonuclease [Rhodoferax sp.]|nr:restriction endonuclease [Rhodoferax sp.]
MSKNSLFAILLRSPWWISMVLVAVFALVSGALLPAPYVPFGVMGTLPFFVIGIIAAWRQWHAPSPARMAEALGRAGAMSWREFASAIEQAFGRQGYAVTRLNSAAADFRLVKGDRITLVSGKRWKAASHGIDALRDLVAAQAAQGAHQSIYISLGEVTDNARRFAQAQGIELISGNGLVQLISDENSL